MDFTPYLGWVNVPDPNNPPAGARLIGASDLLRYEQALVDTAAEFRALPGRYAPKSHTHLIDHIVGLNDALASARSSAELTASSALRGHATTTTDIHGISDTSDLVYTDDPRLSNARNPLAHRHQWSDIDGKPATYRPSSHTHALDDVVDLEDRLDTLNSWIISAVPRTSGIEVVRHVAGSVARPSTDVVLWIGSEPPFNARPGDMWNDGTSLTVITE